MEILRKRKFWIRFSRGATLSILRSFWVFREYVVSTCCFAILVIDSESFCCHQQTGFANTMEKCWLKNHDTISPISSQNICQIFANIGGDHSFSAYANFSEKLTFLTHCYVYVLNDTASILTKTKLKIVTKLKQIHDNR